ncbi:insulinase (Peptidase family m16) domain-containing protein [Ditylenchus destructor]|nr:insulinase (Peptidase family m16) domain-containing protein [Ditylenchus destructor]
MSHANSYFEVSGWAARGTAIIENTNKKVFYYESEKTKLRVAIGLDPTALTPTSNDNGIPHACEHMILMGCKEYPGVRQLLDRTNALNYGVGNANAATYMEHTDYECKNVTQEGFARFLKLLLQYILDPELPANGFLTDVYHIDPKGESGGAIFYELPEFDGSMVELTTRALLKAMHQQTEVYSSESGGIRSRLSNLNMRSLQDYVQKYYHLSNIFITIIGNVKVDNLLENIGKVEQFYLQKYPNRIPQNFQKPFPAQIALIEPSDVITVHCPAVDTKLGFVKMGFFVSFNTEDVEKGVELRLLINYLKPILKQVFADKCGSVDAYLNETQRYELFLEFHSVPVEDLDKIKSWFFDHVPDHITQFNLDQMKTLIDLERRRLMSAVRLYNP